MKEESSSKKKKPKKTQENRPSVIKTDIWQPFWDSESLREHQKVTLTAVRVKAKLQIWQIWQQQKVIILEISSPLTIKLAIFGWFWVILVEQKWPKWPKLPFSSTSKWPISSIWASSKASKMTIFDISNGSNSQNGQFCSTRITQNHPNSRQITRNHAKSREITCHRGPKSQNCSFPPSLWWAYLVILSHFESFWIHSLVHPYPSKSETAGFVFDFALLT